MGISSILSTNRGSFSRFLALALLPSMLLGCHSDTNSPTVSTRIEISPPVLYVVPGGTGDGTQSRPLGSIQAALESSSGQAGIEIRVAVGQYNENVSVDHSVAVIGGFSQQDWEGHADSVTEILGRTVDSLAITCLVDSATGPVLLQHLQIKSPDAALLGGSSYAVYVRWSDSVVLDSCAVIAGNGAAGASGAPGINGQNGDNAPYVFPGIVPGMNPVPGGMGGLGGQMVPCELHNGYPGQNGSCYRDSGGGGAAGAGGYYGGTGGDGAAGTPGPPGRGGSRQLIEHHFGRLILFASEDGTDGGDGWYGCGGGGGGGSSSEMLVMSGCEDHTYAGAYGGGGGAGAGFGTKGYAGRGGGSSIGVIVVSSSVCLISCTVRSGTGGNGGDGGLGGLGGHGGLGNPGDYFPFPGGHGGEGGDGGNGGDGGGGCGGSSVPLLLYYPTSGCNNPGTILIRDSAGIGGGPAGFKGSDGVSWTTIQLH